MAPHHPPETTQVLRTAFKALFTSLCVSLLPLLFMPTSGLSPPAFVYTFPTAWNALAAQPPGKLLHILQGPAPVSPSLGSIALSPSPQFPYLLRDPGQVPSAVRWGEGRGDVKITLPKSLF